MTTAELKAQLKRLKDDLCDLEDMHEFTFGKTSMHIGGRQANNLQQEFEEERTLYNLQIAEIEKMLAARSMEC